MANTLWSNCTSTAWSPSTQKQQDFSVSVNTHKNIFPVTNSFTNPSGLSGQWYVVSALPQAFPNLLQGYHMEALSITADTLGLLPYKLVNHSTTNPSVRHSSEKRQMTIYTVLNKIFVKDERATAVFLWDTACSSHHPYSRNTNSNLNGCKNDWGGCGSDGGRSLSLQEMMKEVGYFKLENYLHGFHSLPSFSPI